MNKRILFVDNGFGGYGGCLSLLAMMNSLKSSNTICFFSLNNNIKKDLLVDNDITYYFCDISNGCHTIGIQSFFRKLFLPLLCIIRFIQNLYVTIKLVKFLKNHEFDIVHSNSSTISCGFWAAKICGIKHVWHLREYIYKDQLSWPIYGFTWLKYLISLSDAVIPISKGVADFYNVMALPIYNGVVSNTEILNLNVKRKDNYILYCGSLTNGKRPDKALLVFSKLSLLYPDLKLVFAGTGMLENYLKTMVRELKLENRVLFLGYVKKTKELYCNARVFLMTSFFEAFGRTTVEAMVNGCIVVGYNSAGTSEIIKDKINGFLYNNDEELFNILNHILNSNDNSFDNLRINAYNWAIHNCSVEMYRNKIENIYNLLN